MQRFVNIASLFEPLTLYFSLFGSFASCEINDMNFGFPAFDNLFLDDLGLDGNGENGVGSGTFVIHLCL